MTTKHRANGLDAGVNEGATERHRHGHLTFINGFKELQAPPNRSKSKAAELTEKKVKAFVKVTQDWPMRELFVESITQTSFHERGWE